MNKPKLVPEFYCFDLKQSLNFYVKFLGFSIKYQRPEENFVYLELEGVEIMLEEYLAGKDRIWETGALERPLGRGVNFQIEIRDTKKLYERLKTNEIDIYHDLECKTYRVGKENITQHQFLVQDPDGYLLRFCSVE